MKLDTQPHWTSDLLSFNSSTLQQLQKSLNVSSSEDVCIFGGISAGGKWAWLARNSNLEIIDTKTGNRMSAFCFGQSTGNTDISITCIKEYQYNGSSKLAVGLRTHSNEGMLCIYDPWVSRVVMAADIPHVVTSVEPVTSCGGVNAPNFALNEHLRCFFGIVAVGTKSGHVYLVDLCLDEEDCSEEVTAKQIKVVTPRTQDVELLREKMLAKGDHLGQEINSNCHSFRSFNYDMPNGKTLKSLYPSEVTITAMKYINQIGSLAVGFNFGGFQLWKLSVPMIEYCSPLTQQTFPVTHFAYQEPEDDPQYFSYLWVGRGPLATDACYDIPTSLHLFQLSYDGKEVHPRYGHIYRDLGGCVPRFQFNLTGDTCQDDQKSEGCRLISCTTLVKELAPSSKHEDSTMEEEDNRQDLNLAAFIWEAPSDPADGQAGSSCFLGLFDLNRWYHAQMPLIISSRDSKHSCSYLAFCSLDSVMTAASPDVLLDLHIDAAHISRYLSIITPTPEQHFHPSALSFDIINLMETGIVTATFLGAQHQVLGDITQLGPSILREPQTFYNRCWASGLLVKRQVLDQGLANLNLQTQREALLSIALDHNLIGFLLDCISSFTLGDFVSGCTLRTILDWAWSKVASIKQSVDQLCLPLYDGFGTSVDEQTMKQLDQHAVQMGHMITIFQSLLDQSGTTTEQGLRDLETKYGVVTLICQHLQVVLWFVKTGLLPECSDNMGDPLEGQFYYPSKRLCDVYAQRRVQLQKLCKSNGNDDILMIDGLMSQVGDALTNLWAGKNDGGSGLYPPPSFHALLDMYLLENVPLATKHSIVGYFLLDIIFTLSDAKYDEMAKKIELFYQCFSLPLGIIKMLQGYWYLDHKDFEQAIEILVDPAVHAYLDASPWQHRNVIRAFLYYNECKRALQYIRTSRSSLFDPEDVELHLTVLIANKLTGEAYEFQRKHRDITTSEDLLHQLFLGSHQTKTMDELLKLPFDDEEDAALVKYLQESTEPNSQELLVMHYLQRGRYVEAIRANEHLKQHSIMDIGSGDPLSRERTCARNVIVESYSKLLPEMQRKLAFGPETGVDRAKLMRKEVVKPRPLSSVINPAKTSKVISHGLLVNAVLDRIAEARIKLRQDETPLKAWLDSVDKEESPPMEPFIGTPVTPRNRTTRLSSSVVYPSAVAANDSMDGYKESPARTISFMAAQTSVVIPTPLCLTDKYKRPVIDYSGAEVLSLLQTPTITKWRTPAVKPKAQEPIPPTPQSILKVRKVARRSPGPSPVAQTATSRLKSALAKGISVHDIPMPTPPLFHNKQLSFAAGVSPSKVDKMKSSTPVKRITFADEAFGKSPEPEPKTTIHHTAGFHASLRTALRPAITTTSPSVFTSSSSPSDISSTKEAPHEMTSLQSKVLIAIPLVGSSPSRDMSPPRNTSPSMDTSPPRDMSPPRDTSPSITPSKDVPYKEPSPIKSIYPQPPLPMDTLEDRGETPTPPFRSPASSPPRLSGSPTKEVSFAPIPTTSQSPSVQVLTSPKESSSDQRESLSDLPTTFKSPFIQLATSPKDHSNNLKSESPSQDLYEPALTEQVVIDHEITFNMIQRDDDEEDEEMGKEDEEVGKEDEEVGKEDEEVVEQEMEEEFIPVQCTSHDMDDTDAAAHMENDSVRPISLIPSPRPPIHPLPEISSSSTSLLSQSSQSPPRKPQQQILQSFPTPPPASREQYPSKPLTSDFRKSSSFAMSPSSHRVPVLSTFALDAPVTTRSMGVSPFVGIGTGIFTLQESVQTSPMRQSFFSRSTITAEMSAQTTPGLSLREEGDPSRPRSSFAVSLQSSRSNVTPPPSGGETEGEGTDREDEDTGDRNVHQTPGSRQITIKQEPLSPFDESRLEGAYTRVKQEYSEMKQEPEDPDDTMQAPSFIFSPPRTRSHTRRQAQKNISFMTTPLLSSSQPSFLMPTMGPTPSDLTKQVGVSSVSKRGLSTSAVSRETTPSLSVRGTPSSAAATPSSRPVTPVSVVKTSTPVRRSPRSRRIKSESTPNVASSPAPPVSVKASTGGRVTRSRKTNLYLEPSDSPVLLISPVASGIKSSSLQRPKRVVKTSHTMTLRTPKKSTRNVKLW